MATESGGHKTGDETGDKTAATAGDERDGGDRWTRRQRRLVTNETAATGGVIYADEGPYTIDVRHLCLASIAKFCDGGL